MMTQYQIVFYPNGDMSSANCRRIGRTTRSWKQAVRIIYWLRRRGVVAFVY